MLALVFGAGGSVRGWGVEGGEEGGLLFFFYWGEGGGVQKLRLCVAVLSEWQLKWKACIPELEAGELVLGLCVFF